MQQKLAVLTGVLLWMKVCVMIPSTTNGGGHRCDGSDDREADRQVGSVTDAWTADIFNPTDFVDLQLYVVCWQSGS